MPIVTRHAYTRLSATDELSAVSCPVQRMVSTHFFLSGQQLS